MGVIAATPMLLLPAFFMIGLLIAWLLMRRHQATVTEQLERLRADRRRLSQKLLIARDRLVERRELAERLTRENASLLEAQDHLESEHAELAVRYANVQPGHSAHKSRQLSETHALQSNLSLVGRSLGSAGADDPLGTGFTKGSLRMVKPFASTSIGKFAKKADPRLNASDEGEFVDDWVANTDAVRLQAPKVTTVEVPLTDLGPESLSEPDLVGPTESPTSIELVSTRFAETLVKFGDTRRPVRQQAIRTLKDMEPDLIGDGPLSSAANDLPQELMLQLAEQDTEIERLKTQLAPLLGLPLAVSAREAERDQLARQLKDRDDRIEILQSELELIQSDSMSTSRATPTDIALTASEPIGAHYPPMPDQVDNLKRIRGIGPVLERMLNRLGIYQYRQIAAWSAEDVLYFDEQLKDFRGRIERDDWIRNARLQHQSKYGEYSQ